MKYDQVISYSRYNEPMASSTLFKEYVKLAKELLPNVKLVTNTNGDFLTEQNLNGLLIDELTIMDYDNKGLEFCTERLNNNGITIDKIVDNYIYAHYKDMKILYFTEWQKKVILQDRGGSLKEYSNLKRTEPCFEPVYFIGIDYNGNIMPCCNVRSDNDMHKEFILGNIYTEKLINIINNNKRKCIIKTTKDNIELLDPCKFCTKSPGRYTNDVPGIKYEVEK